MADPNRYHFREKRIIPRRKFHKKILRPLALWIANQPPGDILIEGFLMAAFWLFVRLGVIHFYAFMVALPWVIMAIALALAGLSYFFQKGDE